MKLERSIASLRSPGWDAAKPAAANAREILPELSTAYFAKARRLCSADPGPSALHELRLDAKRLRYCLELFREHCGPELEQRIQALKAMQQLLGEISDCDSSQEVLRAEALDSCPDGLRLMEFLEARKRASSAAFVERFRTRYDGPDERQAWAAFLRDEADPAAGGRG